MPKLIDHQERKQEIAQAIWTIVQREGIRAVSVRTVAAEAGISTGSLRHVFPSLDEMMLYTVDYVGKRFIRALTEKPLEGSFIFEAENLMGYLSPLSEDGRIFCSVLAGILAEIEAFPQALPIVQEHEADFLYAYRFLLSQIRAHGYLKEGVDIDLEAEKLVALLWGIDCLYLIRREDISPLELASPLLKHFENLLVTIEYPEDLEREDIGSSYRHA